MCAFAWPEYVDAAGCGYLRGPYLAHALAVGGSDDDWAVGS